jgi:hypothetical protein
VFSHSFATAFKHDRSSKSSAIEGTGNACHMSPAGPSPDSSTGRNSQNRPPRPRHSFGAATWHQGYHHRPRREPGRNPRHALLPILNHTTNLVIAVTSLSQPRERSCQFGLSGTEGARGQKMARKGGSTWAGTARAQTTAGRRSVHRQVGPKRPSHDGRRLAQTVRQSWRL